MRGLKLRDFNALCDAMYDDIAAANASTLPDRPPVDDTVDGPIRRTRLL